VKLKQWQKTELYEKQLERAAGLTSQGSTQADASAIQPRLPHSRLQDPLHEAHPLV
jgi:hypothetical protein